MQHRSIKEYLLLSISSFGILVVTSFLMIRILQDDWSYVILDSIIIVTLVGFFAYVYKTRYTDKTSMFLGGFIILCAVVLVWMKGISQVYWGYPVIIALYYLFRVKVALWISALLMIVVGVLTFNQSSLVDFSTIVATLLMANIFAYYSAKNISQKHQSLIQNERLTRLRNKILEVITASYKLSHVLGLIVDSVEQETPDVICSILLIDETGKFLIKGAAPHLPDEFVERTNRIAIGPESCLCGTAAFYKKRIVVNNVGTDLRWTNLADVAAKFNIGACWAEPIISSDGEVVGVFGIYHDVEYTPTKQDFILVEQFAHLASISIEREKNSLLIWEQANFDNLTRLPNRNMMHSHLRQLIARAERDKEKIAIAFLDLDHFKDVNDTLGHDVGDALLIETAKRIKQCIRKNDVVARLGGDEFVVIMSNVKNFRSVEPVVEQLRKSIALPYYLFNEVVHTAVSIGITIYPDDGVEIDDLLKNADQAMYGAKNLGRNNYHYFTQSMREQAVARMQLIHDLRLAIQNKEFLVAYQPIINIQTGAIDKAEALVRWQHPVRGLISPVDFIPLAEETGLIIQISDFVFDIVLSDVKLWRRTLHPNFQVSINTSPVQYKKSTGNIRYWMEILKCENCRGAMAFEITEHLLMEDKQGTDEVLTLVKKYGVELSIDDFGTGYSSLSYLKNYDIDYLKIDKIFVQKMIEDNKDLALCEAIILMAKKLNITVIAEGIETEAQRNLLKTLGCEYGQGYYLSKPIYRNELESLIRNTVVPPKLEALPEN